MHSYLVRLVLIYFCILYWEIAQAGLSCYCDNDLNFRDLVILTLCMLGKFSCFCCSLLTSKNSFSNSIRVSNGMDQDQDQHSVGPDLSPNCLQRLSTATKVVIPY